MSLSPGFISAPWSISIKTCSSSSTESSNQIQPSVSQSDQCRCLFEVFSWHIPSGSLKLNCLRSRWARIWIELAGIGDWENSWDRRRLYFLPQGLWENVAPVGTISSLKCIAVLPVRAEAGEWEMKVLEGCSHIGTVIVWTVFYDFALENRSGVKVSFFRATWDGRWRRMYMIGETSNQSKYRIER